MRVWCLISACAAESCEGEFHAHIVLFGRAHRSSSQSEQQRYILSEEDVRGLDDRKRFLFDNNTKPILADKIRYYEEPFFKARAGDYFHGVPAAYEQRPGAADLPGKAHIDWKGVRALQAAPEGFEGVSPPRQWRDGFRGVAGAAAEDLAPSDHLDPGEYLHLRPVGAYRPDDDDLSVG